VELQGNYAAFQEAGVEVVALAILSPESAEGLQQGLGISYPVLADPEHKVSEEYGVYNLLGDGLAAPAVFVINGDGQVVWQYVGTSALDRQSAGTILSHLP
jgi:peroxiredoxin